MFSFSDSYFHDNYFASDSLKKGRTIKMIFKDLSADMMNMAIKHGEDNVTIYNVIDYPFWHSEEKSSWMIPCHFHEKGNYVIWSEWSEKNTTKEMSRTNYRKIDFFVAKKGVDLFIELKRVSSRFDDEKMLYKNSCDKILSPDKNGSGLLEQIYNMKDITLNYNSNKVLSGILIVNSTVRVLESEQKEEAVPLANFHVNASQLMNEINNMIDGRRNMHLLGNHALVKWEYGDVENIQKDNDIKKVYLPRMLSIIGIFCSS